ncbi:MAG: SMC-Scp complex subunit ScpB [Desulfomonilaceae bacterium]|nr:SMC-Scp complex subunit ScpB [Desulfomonilaceae bacterium]
MKPDLLKSIVEGLIFSHSEPLSAQFIAGVIGEASPKEIQGVLDDLEQEYLLRSRGFVLSKVAGGYQFRSLPAIAPWILEMRRMKPARLSRAGLETLAIVAYNQPITRNQIEQIRGVETAGTIKNLVDRDLIEVVGRKDIPGRPLLYGTSKRFLEVFGLEDLASLPPLPEIEALPNEEAESPSAVEEESAPDES